MKSPVQSLVFTVGILAASVAFAQTPGATSSAKPMASPMSKSTMAPPATAAAAGGGMDKVWVNSESKTYHCYGSKYYGKTKKGEYMSEADAKAKGNHADHGKACKPA